MLILGFVGKGNVYKKDIQRKNQQKKITGTIITTYNTQKCIIVLCV